MIHLVHKSNRVLYARELSHLSTRSVGADGRFDPVLDDRTRHLLALESDGVVAGAVQIHLPERTPGDGSAPRSTGEARLWDGLSLEPSEVKGEDTASELHLAVVELALAHGVDRVSTAIEADDLPAFLQASWQVRDLAHASDSDEGRRVIVELVCDRNTLDRMRRRLGVNGDVTIGIEPGVFPADLTPYGIEALIASQSALSAGEVIEILTLARRSSAQDNRVFARTVRRIAEIQRLEGDEAAFDAIGRLHAAVRQGAPEPEAMADKAAAVH